MLAGFPSRIRTFDDNRTSIALPLASRIFACAGITATPVAINSMRRAIAWW